MPIPYKKHTSCLRRKVFLYSPAARGSFVSDSKELLWKSGKKEIYARLDSTVKEAAEFGISQEDIVDYIKREESINDRTEKPSLRHLTDPLC